MKPPRPPGFRTRNACFVGGLPIVLCLLSAGLTYAEDRVVYTNDFNGPIKSSFPEWTSRTVVSIKQTVPQSVKRLPPPPVSNADTPNLSQRYLGPFGGPAAGISAESGSTIDHTIRLSLKDLGPHSKVTVSFDLYLLDSWDGSETRYGPDRWLLAIVDGPTLLDTTFSNWRHFLQDYPTPKGKARTGAAANDTLGSTFGGDSTYHFTFTVPHVSDTLAMDFRSLLFEGAGIANESWGLDNVEVKVEGEGPPKSKSSGTGNPKFIPLVRGDDPNQFEVVGLGPGSLFIHDGEVRLSGGSKGYIATREEYWDYVLQFEWSYERPKDYKAGTRFEGKSGVLLHIQDPPRVWPKGIAIPIGYNPELGNFSTLGGAEFQPKKDDHDVLAHLLKPVGQWNRHEVTCRNGAITVRVNSVEIARGVGADPGHGKIGFSSEAAPIRFRKIMIKRTS